MSQAPPLFRSVELLIESWHQTPVELAKCEFESLCIVTQVFSMVKLPCSKSGVGL